MEPIDLQVTIGGANLSSGSSAITLLKKGNRGYPQALVRFVFLRCPVCVTSKHDLRFVLGLYDYIVLVSATSKDNNSPWMDAFMSMRARETGQTHSENLLQALRVNSAKCA